MSDYHENQDYSLIYGHATQGGRSQGSEMKRRQALELAKQPYQTVNSAQQAPATAPQATEAPTLAPAPMLISNDDAALAPAPNTGTSALQYLGYTCPTLAQ